MKPLVSRTRNRSTRSLGISKVESSRTLSFVFRKTSFMRDSRNSRNLGVPLFIFGIIFCSQMTSPALDLPKSDNARIARITSSSCAQPRLQDLQQGTDIRFEGRGFGKNPTGGR